MHAILSSQLQVIFMPPVHFSIFIMQRGIIIPVMAGFIVGIVAPIPDIIPVIGFIVAVVMVKLLGLFSTVSGHLGRQTYAEMLIALSER
jgi:hypothetical protein